jgi:adenine-specific DNA glycosylase
MTWRDRAKPIISQVIATHRDEPILDIRRVLRDAYPFGPRKYHPYKVWCSEVRLQLAVLESQHNPNKDIEGLPLFDVREGKEYT